MYIFLNCCFVIYFFIIWNAGHLNLCNGEKKCKICLHGGNILEKQCSVFGLRPSVSFFLASAKNLMSVRGWNTWLSIYMKHEMFNHVYSCQLVVQRKDWSRSLALRHVTAQTQEPELIAAAWVNACVGFIPALSIHPSVRRSINHSV